MKWVWGSVSALFLLWLLAPLLWLLLSSPALSRQEPDAGQLIRAAPLTIFGPVEVSHTGVSHTGQRRRMLSGGWWNGRDIYKTMKNDGWQKVDQFGAVRIYQRQNERLEAICRHFSAFFDVCDVETLPLPRKP